MITMPVRWKNSLLWIDVQGTDILRDNIGAAWMFEVSSSSQLCAPSSAMDKPTCDRRVSACTGRGLTLKWTGKGCRSKKGVAMGDGGCQCSGYCGYKCAGPCKRDSECYWDRKGKLCRVKATGLPGQPVTACSS
jgi:hypothetical protein